MNDGDGYLQPPREMIQILEAPRLPLIGLGPRGDMVALAARRTMVPVAELATPVLHLAGRRILPQANCSADSPEIDTITLRSLKPPIERPLIVPPHRGLIPIGFSPPGDRFAFCRITDTKIELWLADVESGQTFPLTDAAVNGTARGIEAPCAWLRDGSALLCLLVPPDRGAPPAPPRTPFQPIVRDAGPHTPRTDRSPGLLATADDDALFEYYFTSQPALVDARSGLTTPVGPCALLERLDASPDGEVILAIRTTRPYSRVVPLARFPKEVELWSRRGDRIRHVAAIPGGDWVAPGGVIPGARAFRWHPAEAATLVWIEPLDKGDPSTSAPHRDRVVSLPAPFLGHATELFRTEHRIKRVDWTQAGHAVVTEHEYRQAPVQDVDRQT